MNFTSDSRTGELMEAFEHATRMVQQFGVSLERATQALALFRTTYMDIEAQGVLTKRRAPAQLRRPGPRGRARSIKSALAWRGFLRRNHGQ